MSSEIQKKMSDEINGYWNRDNSRWFHPTYTIWGRYFTTLSNSISSYLHWCLNEPKLTFSLVARLWGTFESYIKVSQSRTIRLTLAQFKLSYAVVSVCLTVTRDNTTSSPDISFISSQDSHTLINETTRVFESWLLVK